MPVPTPPSGWRIDERRGTARDLHARWPAVETDPRHRVVAPCRVTGPAVVLGSTQPESDIDTARAAAAGVAVVRRRSGGGAVFVAPGEPVWIDAWVPTGDPLWSADVGRAFDWLGDTWVRALGAVGVEGVAARRGPLMAATRWSGAVCFGGVGTGEVVTAGGRKVVGLAQRRDRAGAWFHGACALYWDARPLTGLLGLAEADRAAAAGELGAAVQGAGDILSAAGDERRLTAEAVTAAFLSALD